MNESNHPDLPTPAAVSRNLSDAASPRGEKPEPRSVSSEQLLGARGELKIHHNGELYSLRRTRQGKLILTK